MKRVFNFVVAALASAAFVTSAPIYADSGQIVVYRPIKKKDDRPRDETRIEKMKEQIETPSYSKPHDSNDAKEELTEPNPVPFNETNLEENLDEQGAADFFDEGRSFEEPVQRAVLFWNGQEEILTLTTVQKSLLPAQGAVISVFPLPGRPIDIYRGDEKLFTKCYDLIKEKVQDTGRVITPLLKREIGSHRIVAFKIDNEKDLYAGLDAYVEQEFGKGAAAYIGAKHRKVLLYYARSGFRYFALDLQTSKPGTKRDKEAISYRFETTKLFYPLVISRLGGSGATTVHLIVVTPNKLTNFSGIQSYTNSSNAPNSKIPDYLVIQTTPAGITFTRSEIRKLSYDAADLLRDYDECYARYWIIKGQMDGFQADLLVGE